MPQGLGAEARLAQVSVLYEHFSPNRWSAERSPATLHGQHRIDTILRSGVMGNRIVSQAGEGDQGKMLTFLTHYVAAGDLAPSLTWDSLSYTAMSLRHVGVLHTRGCISPGSAYSRRLVSFSDALAGRPAQISPESPRLVRLPCEAARHRRGALHLSPMP